MRDSDDEAIRQAKRARARRDDWALLGVCLASLTLITWVLWINNAFQSGTQ